jgi:hypothetical protein
MEKKRMKLDKQEKALALEEKLNVLVSQWRNSSPNNRSSYEERIRKLCKDYYGLTSKYYNWRKFDVCYSAEQIRELNDSFAI